MSAERDVEKVELEDSGMEEEYTGADRRIFIRRRGEHCALHDILWEHHEKDTNNSREMVCQKIKNIADGAKTMTDDIEEIKKTYTPRWVFTLVMTASFLFSLLLFNWIASTVKDGQTVVNDSLKTLHQRITKNDDVVSADTKVFREAMGQLNASVKSIDDRLKTVEKHLENRTGK